MGLPIALASVAAAADEPAPTPQETPAPAFQPGEISIGKPIPLPFSGRGSPPATPDAPQQPVGPPNDDPRADISPLGTSGVAVPGSGWLGLAVAESNVPGRWRIEDVTTGGPAARAGIAVGDELRAVNGVTLASAAEVSQTLTAIAAGQDVKVAVARADHVSEVVLRAEPRPAVRGDQPPQREAAHPASVLARSSAAAATIASTTPATAPAASDPAWQSAQAPPASPAADAQRFGPTPAAMPRSATAPAPLPEPRALAGGGSPASGRTALGVRSVPVDPTTQARFNLASPAGAYVVGVVHDLPAARAGLPPGSVIVALDDHPVRSPVELTELVTRGPLDKPVTVQFVLPGGAEKRADVVLQALDAPLERALIDGSERDAAPSNPQPGPVPRRAQRPASDDGPIRTEIRALRARLERLERLLGPRGAGR